MCKKHLKLFHVNCVGNMSRKRREHTNHMQKKCKLILIPVKDIQIPNVFFKIPKFITASWASVIADKRGSLESRTKICIRLIWTFDLRHIMLSEQCVLIYILSNVVRIIQKISLTKTFSSCMSTLKLWFLPQLWRPLALNQGPIVINVFYQKDVYSKYLSFANMRRYVACLGAMVFKFLWRVTFGGGWAYYF